MRNRRKLIAVLALLTLVCVAGAIVLSTWQGDSSTPAAAYGGGSADGSATAPVHTLADARQASFLSIMVYDANGGVSSFMVGGRTQEFAAFADAMASAAPVSESADASFSDLLILSFPEHDTVEASYSRTRNIMIINDQAYRPTADLAPMIAAVEQRLS